MTNSSPRTGGMTPPSHVGAISLATAARMLGGEVSSGRIVCPGPRHSPRDRSLAVRFNADAPGGFVGDDFAANKDNVRQRLGLPNGEPISIEPARRKKGVPSTSGTMQWCLIVKLPVSDL